jgi:hypothetical protein
MEGGHEAPHYEPGLCLIETGFLVTDKQLLGLCTGYVLLTMGENDRIDPLAATDAAPIDRPDFEYPLRTMSPPQRWQLSGRACCLPTDRFETFDTFVINAHLLFAEI